MGININQLGFLVIHDVLGFVLKVIFVLCSMVYRH